MKARRAIERLLFDYCFGIDAGDFAFTAALFGDDGLYGLVGGQAARGSAQVLGMMQASVRTYDGVPRTRHVVTNVCIDIGRAGEHDGEQDGEHAAVRSYLQVLHQPPGGGPVGAIVVGTYLDRVHVVDDRWLFAERRMHLELVGDLRTHLNEGFL